MLDVPKLSAEEKVAYEKLKSWDFFNSSDSEGASYFEAWLRAIAPMIWDEIETAKVHLPDPTAYTTIKLIKEKPDLSFFDIISTPEKETALDVVRKSFFESVHVIEEWKYTKKKE